MIIMERKGFVSSIIDKINIVLFRLKLIVVVFFGFQDYIDIIIGIFILNEDIMNVDYLINDEILLNLELMINIEVIDELMSYILVLFLLSFLFEMFLKVIKI